MLLVLGRNYGKNVRAITLCSRRIRFYFCNDRWSYTRRVGVIRNVSHRRRGWYFASDRIYTICCHKPLIGDDHEIRIRVKILTNQLFSMFTLFRRTGHAVLARWATLGERTNKYNDHSPLHARQRQSTIRIKGCFFSYYCCNAMTLRNTIWSTLFNGEIMF